MSTTTITYIHLRDGGLLSEGVFAEGESGQLAVVNFLERCAEYGWYLTPQDREDMIRHEEQDLKRELLGDKLDAQKDVAGMRNGPGGVADRFTDRQAETINKERGKVATMRASADSVDKMLEGGTEIGRVRSFLATHTKPELAEFGADESQKELIRQIQNEARLLNADTGGKTITPFEAQLIARAAQGGGMSFEDMKHIHALAKEVAAAKEGAADALGTPEAQRRARVNREAARGK